MHLPYPLTTRQIIDLPNPFQHNKSLDHTKFKAYADNKLKFQ